ncbi:MAG: energy transducer TonB [Terriglobia bacterium]
MTPPINPKDESGTENTLRPAKPPDDLYHAVLIEDASTFASLWKAFKERGKTPRMSVPAKYYHGEATLPLSDTKPLARELVDRVKSLWEKPAPPSIPITSQPIDVPDIWQDYKPRKLSFVNGLVINIAIVGAIFLPYLIFGPPHVLRKPNAVEVTLAMPVNLAPAPKRAGGGGGQHDNAPASKGALPKFSRVQYAPPMAKIDIPKPKLPVDPSLLGTPNMTVKMASNLWGDPKGVPGPPSMGNGHGTGIGNGNGAGYGLGDTAGLGGLAYSPGGGVSTPVPIFDPDPPYTEQAREAKYQGDVVLLIVVQPDGSVSNAQVVKPAGLGLDESALKTVRSWKFKPGMRNGLAVPVQMQVDVTFRLL